MFARLALSAATYPIDKPYDYSVPADLESAIKEGMRVLVPFGNGNRISEGVVLSLTVPYIRRFEPCSRRGFG